MEKNFGYTFFIVSIIIGIYPLLNGNEVNLFFLGLAIFFLFMSLLAPNKLFIPAKIWLNFGRFLGKFTSPIIMILTYILSVVSVGLLLRVLRIDILDIRINKNKKSYWKKSAKYDESLDNQF